MAIRISAQFIEVVTINANTQKHRVEQVYVESIGDMGVSTAKHRVEQAYVETIGGGGALIHRVEQAFVEVIGSSGGASHRVEQAFAEVIGSSGPASHRVEQAYVEIIGDGTSIFNDTVTETGTAVDTPAILVHTYNDSVAEFVGGLTPVKMEGGSNSLTAEGGGDLSFESSTLVDTESSTLGALTGGAAAWMIGI